LAINVINGHLRSKLGSSVGFLVARNLVNGDLRSKLVSLTIMGFLGARNMVNGNLRSKLGPFRSSGNSDCGLTLSAPEILFSGQWSSGEHNIYIYIYIYGEREREREKEGARERKRERWI